MAGTTPEYIQTPIIMPMTRRIRIDCKDLLMPLIIIFSSADHLKPISMAATTATTAAKKRAACTLSTFSTSRATAISATVMSRTSTDCQNLGSGLRAVFTFFFSFMKRIPTFPIRTAYLAKQAHTNHYTDLSYHGKPGL